MAGQAQSVAFSHKHATGRIGDIIITIRILEIEHTGVEGKRLPHIAAADGPNDCHVCLCMHS
jgi:hypothetical protein